MNIYLLHPSRGRPDQAESAIQKWVELSVDAERLTHIFSLDTSDERKFAYHCWDYLETNDNRTMVEALNRCIEHLGDGIAVTLYDDMTPSEGWDQALVDAYEPGKLLHVDCGLLLQTVCAGCTSVFKRWGYVYYPGYVSMFADNDYQEHGEAESLFVDCAMSVEHKHPAHGTAETDATYQRQNHSAAYAIGERILQRRRLTKFEF